LLRRFVPIYQNGSCLNWSIRTDQQSVLCIICHPESWVIYKGGEMLAGRECDAHSASGCSSNHWTQDTIHIL
jgi:hypothetical protein